MVPVEQKETNNVKNSNQTLHYTCVIHTLHYNVTYFDNECKNLVTSLRAHVGVVSPAVNTTPFEERSQQGRAVRNTASDLIFPRF